MTYIDYKEKMELKKRDYKKIIKLCRKLKIDIGERVFRLITGNEIKFSAKIMLKFKSKSSSSRIWYNELNLYIIRFSSDEIAIQIKKNV